MFGLNNSKERLNQLEQNYKVLQSEPLNLSITENCCSMAFHLKDWIYLEYYINKVNGNNYHNMIYQNCPELNILHDFVNKVKHKDISKPKVQIANSQIHEGGFNSGFSKGFNVSRLTLVLGDGSQTDLDDLLKASISYWRTLIVMNTP